MTQAEAQALTPVSLKISPRIEERLRSGALTRQQVKDFSDFLDQVNRELLQHRIVVDNPYTRWFRKGEATEQELKHFIRQFSVFSNLFLVAQLLKVINAPTLDQMHASKGNPHERAGR